MQNSIDTGVFQVIMESTDINTVIGENAKIDIEQALNYIKSGEEEIKAAVSDGTAAFNLNAAEKQILIEAQANIATSQAQTAMTQATAATNSASQAADYADSASTSASTAITQADIATTKANEASASAGNAGISEINAANSALNASTSATNANNSAISAAQSASDAAQTLLNAGSSLDYTGNTLSLENSSGTVLSSVTINPMPYLDNKSITLNSNNQLQTVGVINQNAPTTAIKTWTGTKVQYDAIVSKDPNTLYNTDNGLWLGTTKIADLSFGKADIDLSNVPASKGILVESYVNGTSWYRVYSDGWCEQGGSTGLQGGDSYTRTTITFLKPFANTDYTITSSPNKYSTQNGLSQAYPPFIYTKNTNTCVFGGFCWTDGFDWQACGYIN